MRQLLVKKQALAWIASFNRGSNGARRLFSAHLDLDSGCYWRRTEARHSSFAITGSELAAGGVCKFVDLADEGGERKSRSTARILGRQLTSFGSKAGGGKI